jgi:hypothetical protein
VAAGMEPVRSKMDSLKPNTNRIPPQGLDTLRSAALDTRPFQRISNVMCGEPRGSCSIQAQKHTVRLVNGLFILLKTNRYIAMPINYVIGIATCMSGIG